MVSGGRVADAITSLVMLATCSLSVLHETLLVPVLMYGNENVMEGERS